MTVRFLPVFIVCALFAVPPAAAGETAIGSRRIMIEEPDHDRRLQARIWYPAAHAPGQAQTLFGDNPAFVGVPVVEDADVDSGRYPLVVMSHGYGGNFTNQAWLASELVRHGYVVAAVNHPGTTSRDRSPAQAVRLAERPRDLSRVIDALTAHPAFASAIDVGRIAAIGHSLGGWTIIGLAGGHFSAELLEADCGRHLRLAACDVYDELGLRRSADDRSALGGGLSDARLKAAVAIDIGLARGFTPESLAAISVPVLVIAASADNPKVPPELESGYLLRNLPAGTAFARIDGAAHFSFLANCKEGAVALLEEEAAGEGIVCRDGGDRLRSDIHVETSARIVAFLAQTMGQQK